MSGSEAKRDFAIHRLLQLSVHDLLSLPTGISIPDPAIDGLILGHDPKIRTAKEEREFLLKFDDFSPGASSKDASINRAKWIMTRTSRSPLVELPLKEWSSVLRCQDTWIQIMSPEQQVDDPSLSQYIASFRYQSPRHYSLEEVQEALEQAEADLAMKVNIPWGCMAQLHPVFGLIVPSTPVPILDIEIDSFGHSVRVSPLADNTLDQEF